MITLVRLVSIHHLTPIPIPHIIRIVFKYYICGFFPKSSQKFKMKTKTISLLLSLISLSPCQENNYC